MKTLDPAVATSLYYAFSTFSQTLAGAIGFLAAVVLYRIQRLDDELVRHGDKIISHWPDVSPEDSNGPALLARQTWVRRDYSGLLKTIEALPLGTIHSHRRYDVQRFRILLGQRVDVLSAFQLSLALTVLTIAASGLVLVWTPWLHADWAPPVLVAGYAAFALCLATFVRVAKRIFAEPPSDEPNRAG